VTAGLWCCYCFAIGKHDKAHKGKNGGGGGDSGEESVTGY
jgi:hypothetical protein